MAFANQEKEKSGIEGRNQHGLIIHFTEAGGGVLTSISQIINLTPEFKHIVLARKRENFSDFSLIDENYAQLIQWNNSLLIGMLKLAILKCKNANAIVHLHSSKCGAARFLPAFSKSIYSPHCYSFERKDIGVIKSSFFKTIEFLAARRTSLIICVSQREEALSLKLNGNSKTLIHEHVISEWKSEKPNKTIIALGRICDQKNPELFLEIVKNIRKKHSDIRYIWIGDGSRAKRQLLLENGVEVTGWLKSDKVNELLSQSSLLLHCALWEGMPVVFSEALAGGIPVVAKMEDYLVGNHKVLTYQSALEAATICLNIVLEKTRNEGYSADKTHAAEKLYDAYTRIR
jgi:glycosyltransferase involved in cell wall biosynthesis